MFLCVFWFALPNRSLEALDYMACNKTPAIVLFLSNNFFIINPVSSIVQVCLRIIK